MRHSAYIIGFVVICGPFTGLMALNVNVKTRIEVKTHNEGESRAGVEGSRSPVYQGSRLSSRNKAGSTPSKVETTTTSGSTDTTCQCLKECEICRGPSVQCQCCKELDLYCENDIDSQDKCLASCAKGSPNCTQCDGVNCFRPCPQTTKTTTVSPDSTTPGPPEYSYRSNEYCGSSYGYYTTLGQAKTACDADSNCMGIMDNGCNGFGYNLCRQGGSWVSQSHYCSYEKQV